MLASPLHYFFRPEAEIRKPRVVDIMSLICRTPSAKVFSLPVMLIKNKTTTEVRQTKPATALRKWTMLWMERLSGRQSPPASAGTGETGVSLCTAVGVATGCSGFSTDALPIPPMTYPIIAPRLVLKLMVFQLYSPPQKTAKRSSKNKTKPISKTILFENSNSHHSLERLLKMGRLKPGSGYWQLVFGFFTGSKAHPPLTHLMADGGVLYRNFL